jgi:hypothetical protein
MLKPQRIVYDVWSTRIKDPLVRGLWSLWLAPIYLSPICTGIQPREQEPGLIESTYVVYQEGLICRGMPSRQKEIRLRNIVRLRREAHHNAKDKILRTFHIRMHPSKALNMIANGTKSREGRNDLRSRDQISEGCPRMAGIAHSQLKTGPRRRQTYFSE